MKVSLSWLAEYTNPPKMDRLVKRLNETGTSVEAVTTFGEGLDQIIVGEILDVIPHPNADKLSVAKVKIPNKELNIVCGAPNITQGQKVPVAPVGASVPKGPEGAPMKIERRKIREVESKGMLCSARELGLGENHDGILILDPDTRVGEKLNKLLHLPDTIIDTEVTPNRGDKLSIYGTAREVSAVTNEKLEEIKVPKLNIEGEEISLSAEITNPNLCRRYCAVAIGGIKIAPSPAYIQIRLAASGLRPVNNVVDITNYVMLLIGQPLHAFDKAAIEGNKIIIRASKKDEELTTLDGITRTLPPGSVVIADTKQALALGGVMGGQSSAISEQTEIIVLESAVFDPVAIRRTSMLLNLNSEASHRFQRHVDPTSTITALELAVDLLKKHASGFITSRVLDLYPNKVKAVKVTLPKDKLDQYLGYEMTINQASQTLENLGYHTSHKTENELTATVPSWREHDVSIPEDLIEDIASIEGYHKIPPVLPTGVVEPLAPTRRLPIITEVKNHLVSLGMREIYTYSMTSQDIVKQGASLKITNPTSKEWEFMRTSLIPALTETLHQNLSWGIDNDLFELSKVYLPRDKDLPNENLRLALSARDLDTAKSLLGSIFSRLDISSPTYEEKTSVDPQTLVSVKVNGHEIGSITETSRISNQKTALKYNRILSEIDFEKVVELAHSPRQFKLPAKFPTVTEDLTFEVDAKTKIVKIMEAAMENKHIILRNVDYAGTYTGNDLSKKSVTLSLIFRSDEKTLTAEEVKQARQEIAEKLKSSLNAKIG
jgi:phenylalanyl-tRNA synthetase beta chain